MYDGEEKRNNLDIFKDLNKTKKSKVSHNKHLNKKYKGKYNLHKSLLEICLIQG